MQYDVYRKMRLAEHVMLMVVMMLNVIMLSMLMMSKIMMSKILMSKLMMIRCGLCWHGVCMLCCAHAKDDVPWQEGVLSYSLMYACSWLLSSSS